MIKVVPVFGPILIDFYLNLGGRRNPKAIDTVPTAHLPMA
ncbi:hypothetical protein SPH9361_03907 [Sphingobium sp. CECT 9361]|nr:hypothetical protein SPH9361_03907 [Sphingobium sp. CECT 9361]